MVSSPVKITEDGIRKAAILVASLDRAAADAVLELLGPEQAQQVRHAVVAMDDIPAAEQEQVLDEFARLRPGKSGRETSGVELAGRLAKEIGWGAANYHEQESAAEEPTGRPFRRLHDAEGEKLARLLSGERPQTIALVLSHLPPRQAGGVLVRFPSDLQIDVVRRLVDLEETDPVILREVEKTLEARLSRQVQMQRRRVAGLEALSGILEESSSDVSMKILDNLSIRDCKLAQKNVVCQETKPSVCRIASWVLGLAASPKPQEPRPKTQPCPPSSEPPKETTERKPWRSISRI